VTALAGNLTCETGTLGLIAVGAFSTAGPWRHSDRGRRAGVLGLLQIKAVRGR
jgi:hypothetical protein